MAGLRQPPASWTAVVEAPRRTSSDARPRRPECDETFSRPSAAARILDAAVIYGSAVVMWLAEREAQPEVFGSNTCCAVVVCRYLDHHRIRGRLPNHGCRARGNCGGRRRRARHGGRTYRADRSGDHARGEVTGRPSVAFQDRLRGESLPICSGSARARSLSVWCRSSYGSSKGTDNIRAEIHSKGSAQALGASGGGEQPQERGHDGGHGGRLSEQGAGEPPRQAGLELGEPARELVGRHVVSGGGGLAHGVNDGVGVLGLDAGVGQAAGDGVPPDLVGFRSVPSSDRPCQISPSWASPRPPSPRSPASPAPPSTAS